MCQTRISGDVWKLAQEVAAARGLGNPRTAIEAIVRVYAAAYMHCQTIELPAPHAPAPAATATNEPSAQDAFNSLLSEL